MFLTTREKKRERWTIYSDRLEEKLRVICQRNSSYNQSHHTSVNLLPIVNLVSITLTSMPSAYPILQHETMPNNTCHLWLGLSLSHFLSHTPARAHAHTYTHTNQTFARRLDTRLLSHIPSSPWLLSQPTICTPGDKLRWGVELRAAGGCSNQYRLPSALNHCTCSLASIASLIRGSAPQPPIFQPECRPRGVCVCVGGDVGVLQVLRGNHNNTKLKMYSAF